MLFNSYAFLFLFLPITLAAFFLVARHGRELAIGLLVLASLFFYGWWNPVYLLLILVSMLVNFGLGELLSRASRRTDKMFSKLWLWLGVAFNLGLLGYFKYAGFLVGSLNIVAGTNFDLGTIVLPLAISFFTFQQIAYLVDAYRGITQEYSFTHYALFVTFFPQLIAGPIVHHSEMLPQFMRDETLRPRLENIAVGLSIFAIGLFKKTVLADGVSHYATPAFDAAAHGETLTLFEAWGGALAYTFQLYFDFSGYSDMAIGGARLFGIRLPLNFHSPYKATSIIEFWRRWHMTLSRFLRDYLYISLGGNRGGPALRYRNLMVTMLLGGLWHGAGWTFVVWGGLHGLYLVINHGWHWLRRRLWSRALLAPGLSRLVSWALTFLAVIVGWVFFRAANFDAALEMLRGMAGFNGVAIPNGVAVHLGWVWEWLSRLGLGTYLGGGTNFVATWLWLALLLPAVLLVPNTQQLLARGEPALQPYSGADAHELVLFPRLPATLAWRPGLPWAVILGIAAAFGVLAMSSVSEFLYFQF